MIRKIGWPTWLRMAGRGKRTWYEVRVDREWLSKTSACALSGISATTWKRRLKCAKNTPDMTIDDMLFAKQYPPRTVFRGDKGTFVSAKHVGKLTQVSMCVDVPEGHTGMFVLPIDLPAAGASAGPVPCWPALASALARVL
jgi:hypothetical protein